MSDTPPNPAESIEVRLRLVEMSITNLNSTLSKIPSIEQTLLRLSTLFENNPLPGEADICRTRCDAVEGLERHQSHLEQGVTLLREELAVLKNRLNILVALGAFIAAPLLFQVVRTFFQ